MAPEPIAVALDIDPLAVVQQPVKDGGGNYRIAEQFLPVTEALIGSNYGLNSFVSVRDKLKETGRPLGGADRQIGFVSKLATLLQVSDQGFHGDKIKIDLKPMAAGLGGEANGYVKLAYSRRPQKDHISCLGIKVRSNSSITGFLFR